MTEPVPRRRSVGYTTWQVRRVLSVIAWFRHHPDGTLMRAAAQFGVTVPQLRHELTQAATCGVPPYLPGSLLEFTTSGMHVDVVTSLGLDRAPSLTAAESGALLLSLERLASVMSGPGRADVDSAAEMIRGLQQDVRDRRDRFVPDEFTTATRPAPGSGGSREGTPSVLAENLPALREALSDRRWVKLTYRSASSDSVGRRCLVPDQLEFIDGQAYLWAREDSDPKDQRCFNVSRMSAVTVTDRPAPEALGRAVDPQDPFGFDRDGQRWAEIELEDDAAWMFEYLPIWQVDGPGPLRAAIPDTGDWLERFLLAYAPTIRAVVPQEEEPRCDLAHRVARRASAALDAYRSLA
ncbi:WYL domain-containing protein [Corynebacterium sp.]|uniref:WYL domain-containing protein n=1 Tax=Corynebacterium sp. TaxID=1720 RepID=UPI0025B94232|nr:WYL domain-containing protein [Corynebacterium sp.]